MSADDINTTDQADASTEELIDPITGEIVADTDDLITSWERAKDHQRHLDHYCRIVAERIAALATEGTGRTRRVRGNSKRVRIELPDDSWDQSKLKEAFHSYPQFRDEFLRIESVGVRMREWKKALSEAGEPAFETFKHLVKSANRGPTGSPRITIEE